MQALTLKQLRYFSALERHRHFGRAAEACAVSQPALSVQIRDLEELMGAALFERSARQVRLTAFGEVFAHRARDILLSVDELSGLARAGDDRPSGPVRMGVIPTVAPYLLPRVIAALTAAFDGIDLALRETRTATLIRDLSEGRLDTAIVALPISEPSFTECPLFDEEFMLVRPAAEAGAPIPDAEGLREMRLFLLEEGHCFRDQALEFCKMGTLAPRELLEGSSLSTLVQMVGAGLGVTLIPEMAVEVETRSAPVSVARFHAPRPSRRIGMIWRRASPLADQMAQLAPVVREAADRAWRERPDKLTL